MLPVISSWYILVDSAKRPGDANPQGMLIVVPGGSFPINDSAISLKPDGGIFSWAPEVSTSGSSTTQHSCLGEPQDEAGVESLWSPLSCSSIWWHQALLLLELQLWQHHLRSPKLKGTCPTEATGWDGWISVQLGYLWPICYLWFPKVTLHLYIYMAAYH